MTKMHTVSFTLNGKPVDVTVEPRELLIHTLRETLAHTGPHIGCETSHCGACTVDLDGMSVKSCTVLTVQCDGARAAHRRGPGAGRRAARAAAGLPRGARPAVRLLHAGHADARLPAAAGEPGPERGGDPLRHLPATCAAAPATRTSSRRCSRRRKQAAPPCRPEGEPPWATCPNSRSAKHKLQGMGTSLLRKEDARFIRGQGSYVDDIKLPGMLFGALVRSPYAHARIKSIDKTQGAGLRRAWWRC